MVDKIYVKESAVIYKNTRRKITAIKLTHKEAVAEFVRTILPPQPQENFIVIGAGADLTVRDWSLISLGNHSTCVIDPKAILRWALLTGCCALITAHNHPSGNAKPSAEDVAVHLRLEKAAKIIDLQLIDSVVVGDHEVISIAEGQIS